MADKVIGYIGRQTPPAGGGSEPPMELAERVAHLEKDVSDIKSDVAVIRSNYSTKEDLALARADLHKELHGMTWKIFGFAGLLTGAVYFIARYIH